MAVWIDVVKSSEMHDSELRLAGWLDAVRSLSRFCKIIFLKIFNFYLSVDSVRNKIG
jgi:hypothetical protein